MQTRSFTGLNVHKATGASNNNSNFHFMDASPQPAAEC
jgi:hypothetical protein